MDTRRIYLSLFLLALKATTSVAFNCEGRYIDNHCINVRLDGKDWSRSEAACSDYSIPGFKGAHLAAITTPGRHKRIVEFMKQMGMGVSWLGGRRNTILWKWLKDNTDLSSQGCYSNLTTHHNFQIIKSDTPLDTQTKCIETCFESQRGFAATLNNECYCGDSLGAGESSVACGDNVFSVFRVGGLPGKWGNGEPTIATTQPSPDSCISLRQGYGLMAKDCSLRLRFLCRIRQTKNPSSSPTTPITCPRPYARIHDGCYWLSNVSYTWQPAKQACFNILGDLASMTTNLIQNAIEAWMVTMAISEEVWVGGYKGGWFWLSANTFSFTNWAPGEPKKSSSSSPNDCIILNPDSSYQWSAIQCPSSPIYFICQVGYDYSFRPNGEAIIINVLPPSNTTPPTASPSNTLPQITFGTDDIRMQRIEYYEDQVDKNNVRIVTWVFIGVAIFLILLILLCCLILFLVKKRRKVDVVVDARPVAHLPESSTEKLRDNDQLATVA